MITLRYSEENDWQAGINDKKSKVRVQSPDQTSKAKYENISSATSSADFWQKIWVNKSAMKSFSFRVSFKLKVPSLLYIIDTYNINGVRR